MVESEVEHRMGHGLENMRDRAKSLGGSIAIGPVETGGTEVRVAIPPPDQSGSEPHPAGT
jgi:signal transduction histidine kinase